MIEYVLSPEVIVPVVTFVIGFVVEYLLEDKKKRKVFHILVAALEESMEELELDEKSKFKTFYKVVEKLNNVPEDTKKAEDALVEKLKN